MFIYIHKALLLPTSSMLALPSPLQNPLKITGER